jgi:hypothetical protein
LWERARKKAGPKAGYFLFFERLLRLYHQRDDDADGGDDGPGNPGRALAGSSRKFARREREHVEEVPRGETRRPQQRRYAELEHISATPTWRTTPRLQRPGRP